MSLIRKKKFFFFKWKKKHIEKQQQREGKLKHTFKKTKRDTEINPLEKKRNYYN